MFVTMARGLGIWLVSGVALFAGCSGGAFSADSNGNNVSGGNAGKSSAAQAGKGGSTSTAGTHTTAGSQATNGGSAGKGTEPSGGTSTNDTAGAGGVAEPPSECPCSAPTPTCQTGKCVVRGPSMVKSDVFYVDSTEVTVAQYAAFLKAKGDDTSQQAPECTWNHSFAPLPTSSMGPPAAADSPVTGVDYCDAAAYCAWTDKRLCGKIGGGKLAFDELASATKSEWFAACGGPSGQLYPYGGAHKDGACNDSSGSGVPASIGSFKGCTGFYAGVVDMVGNVAEWVNACDATAGAVDGCETIGGSYADTATCSTSSLKHRNEQLPTVGFRCCGQ
jgi:sulfatase modifying factor 1